MRVLVRPRRAVLALLLLAPSVPELLTGSTPVSGLFFDPIRFAVDFAFLVGLYGGGALLIREFSVALNKGWASILLLGAAYGIAEEGFAVHTFFRPSGSPVGALGSYGHAYGVNWLWALGISAFHATYSIALPILLVGLWFPEARRVPWLDGGSRVVIGLVYLAVIAVFASHEGFGPSHAALAFFLGVVALLIVVAWWAPRDLVSVRPGPGRASPLGLVLVGTVGFDGWVLLLVLAANHRLPAVAAAAVLVALNLLALGFVTRRVGTDRLELSEFYFATGMLVALFLWDIPVGFVIPGLWAVAAVFAYVQYRLGRRVLGRPPALDPVVPPGVRGLPPPSAG